MQDGILADYKMAGSVFGCGISGELGDLEFDRAQR